MTQKRDIDYDFTGRMQQIVEKMGGQNALSRASGVSLGSIQKALSGSEPTRMNLIRLAKASGVTLSWLAEGLSLSANGGEHSASPHRAIPVIGFAECGVRGWYNQVPWQINAGLDCPDPEVFAIAAIGQSMIPEGIRPGFVCIASPNTRPTSGDLIVIRKEDGTATIKRYDREDQDWLHITGYLDPDEKGYQMDFSEKVKKSIISQVATIIFVKRRV